MDPTTRYIVGLLIVYTFQTLVGGTAVFLIRRKKRLIPPWSWTKTIGAFIVLGLIAVVVGVVPVVGLFAAVIVSLVGLKRMTGLDILSTFILSFCLGVSAFVVATLLSRQLDVDLLQLQQRVSAPHQVMTG